MGMRRTRFGFTLIEIMVVITIITIFAGTVYFVANQGSAAGRDADRQNDLTRLKDAVERFKQQNGHYPAGCNGPGRWSGEPGTSMACGSGGQYITGLTPDFIRTLPRDPNIQPCLDRVDSGGAALPDDCGFAYVTNADGSVYKIMVMNTVEGEVVTASHPLKSCDHTGASNPDIRIDGWCGALWTGGSSPQQTESTPSHPCNVTNRRFQSSYGTWGGFSPPVQFCLGSRCINPTTDPTISPLENFSGSPNAGVQRSLRPGLIQNTTAIICM
jgi:prepilin-type N-terminal cleavage/methylation domain-containing protein